MSEAVSAPTSGLPPLQWESLRWSSPWGWLRQGWQDLRAAWWPSVAFGLAFWAMALALGWIFQGQPAWTMTMVSGCFLVGPFLAMGLYDISRRRGAGLPQDFAASLTCWDRHLPSMAMLVLVLMVLELLWGRASLVVFAVFFQTGMPSTASVLQAVLAPENWPFVATYVLVGAGFATLVFATCVVSVPMILDRDTDAVTAGLRSVQLVLARPGVMLWWAALIVGLTGIALALPWAAGVVVVVPWLGHASWHAYRQVMPTPAVHAQGHALEVPVT
jgi:uncharacterized membrane protein